MAADRTSESIQAYNIFKLVVTLILIVIIIILLLQGRTGAAPTPRLWSQPLQCPHPRWLHLR